MVYDAAVAVGGPVVGVELDGAREVGEGGFEVADFGMGQAAVVVGVAVAGVEFYGACHITHRLGEVAEAQVGYAQVVARHGVGRVERDHSLHIGLCPGVLASVRARVAASEPGVGVEGVCSYRRSRIRDDRPRVGPGCWIRHGLRPPKRVLPSTQTAIRVPCRSAGNSRSRPGSFRPERRRCSSASLPPSPAQAGRSGARAWG